MWSDCVKRSPQHLMAICWSAEPIGSNSMRSAIVCSRVWNVEGRGWTASPAILMSLNGCSHTPCKSWKWYIDKDLFTYYVLENTDYFKITVWIIRTALWLCLKLSIRVQLPTNLEKHPPFMVTAIQHSHRKAVLINMWKMVKYNINHAVIVVLLCHCIKSPPEWDDTWFMLILPNGMQYECNHVLSLNFNVKLWGLIMKYIFYVWLTKMAWNLKL
jgi:hypothetical protein